MIASSLVVYVKLKTENFLQRRLTTVFKLQRQANPEVFIIALGGTVNEPWPDTFGGLLHQAQATVLMR